MRASSTLASPWEQKTAAVKKSACSQHPGAWLGHTPGSLELPAPRAAPELPRRLAEPANADVAAR